MKCFKCDKGRLTKRTVDVSGVVRGEEYIVRREAMVCNRCGFQVLSEEQSGPYTVAISDTYREKHGLLTSEELKQIRRRLGLSQQAFASYLKVGMASVKRWESGLIQDEAMDQLIRLKTDLRAARQNLAELEGQLGTEQSSDLWKEILLKISRPSPKAPAWYVPDEPYLTGGVRVERGPLSAASLAGNWPSA